MTTLCHHLSCGIFVFIMCIMYSSCDLSSASLQQPKVVSQHMEADDAGKLTEADKAQTGRVIAHTHTPGHLQCPGIAVLCRFI